MVEGETNYHKLSSDLLLMLVQLCMGTHACEHAHTYTHMHPRTHVHHTYQSGEP